MKNSVLDALNDMLAAAQAIGPGQTVGTSFDQTDEDSDLHRLGRRRWSCAKCDRGGDLSDVLLAEDHGGWIPVCPHCDALDTLAMTEQAGHA